MKAEKKLLITSIGSLVALCPSRAFAHPIQGVGDFYAGMLHPLTAVESALAILALSLLAGQQSREIAIQLLFVLPTALLTGALLGFVHPGPSVLGFVQLGFATILGALVALARPLPKSLLLALAAALGVAVGWFNAGELTGEISRVRFVAGLTMVGLLLITYGIGLVRRLTVPWSQIAVRVVGSWIATIGILVLGLK